MNLMKISLLSIRRQLGKRVFLLITLGLSLSAVLSLIVFVQSQERSIEQQFDEYGANIIITPRKEDLSLSYGGISVSSVVTDIEELSSADAQRILSIPSRENIRAVSPKLIGSVSAESEFKTSHALLVGVILEEERKIKSWWDLAGSFPEGESEVLLGADVAENLNLLPGDDILLSGEKMKVAGVLYPTGSQDDQVIMASLAWTERLLGREGKVSLIDVSALCSDCPIDELVAQISSQLPQADVKALSQVMDQRMAMVSRFRQFAMTLAVLIALLSGFLTFSVMTASVSERHKEIGVFRALGFSRRNILTIIQRETLLVAISAGFLGILITLLTSFSLLPRFTGLAPGQIYLPPVLPLAGFVALLLLSLGSSMIPAVRAAGIDPIESMNSL